MSADDEATMMLDQDLDDKLAEAIAQTGSRKRPEQAEDQEDAPSQASPRPQQQPQPQPPQRPQPQQRAQRPQPQQGQQRRAQRQHQPSQPQPQRPQPQRPQGQPQQRSGQHPQPQRPQQHPVQPPRQQQRPRPQGEQRPRPQSQHPVHSPHQQQRRPQRPRPQQQRHRTRPFRPLPQGYFKPVPRRHVEILDRVAKILPRPGLERAPAQTITSVLEELTSGSHYRINLLGTRLHPAPFRLPDIDNAMVTRFELPPHADSGVLVIDTSLLQGVLGKMLGDFDASGRRVGPTGHRDFGIATYVLLRILDACVEQHQAPPFTFAGTPPTHDEVRAQLKDAIEVIEVAMGVSGGDHSGTVRVFLPTELLHHIAELTETPISAERRVTQLADTALASATVRPWIGVARLGVSRFELVDLRPGDVLVPAEHALDLDGIAAGDAPARMYVSPSRHIYIPVAMQAEDGTWRADIQSTDCQVAEDMMSDQAQNASTSSEATGALLEESDLTLEVRVGAASITVSEMADLQVGQVVDLDVPLGQPVSLVVGDQVVGTGELVNIEGKLGVRVLSRR